MNSRFLKLTAAAIALIGFVPAAHADTVTTKTVVQQKDIPNVNRVDMTMFDLNHDKILSRDEVGEYLFKVFDTDNNHNIDNIEFKQPKFITLIPMEKETMITVDFDNDGVPDKAEHTYESFVQLSQLGRFDDDQDGLSAKEFINTGYEVLDDDEDRQISLEEWKEAYGELLHITVNEPERYN